MEACQRVCISFNSGPGPAALDFSVVEDNKHRPLLLCNERKRHNYGLHSASNPPPTPSVFAPPTASGRESLAAAASMRKISSSSSTSSLRRRATQLAHPAESSRRRSSGASEYFGTWCGRKIRTPGPMPWPCDSLELERVEAQHWLLRLLLGTPFIGPVDEVLRKAGNSATVLDLATGVGVWATDMGDMYPWAKVIGADNVPIQEA